MKIFISTVVLILMISNISFAQGEFVAEEMFLVRYPSAKSESMGRSFMADNGSPYAIFFNPAGISGGSDYSIVSSLSDQIGFLDDAKFYYGAGTWEINEKSTVGVAVQHFDWGNSSSGYESTRSKYSISGAHKLSESLSLGVSLNYFSFYLKGNEPYDSFNNPLSPEFDTGDFYGDIGIIKTIIKDRKDGYIKCMDFGMSIINVSNARVHFEDNLSDRLPSIFRAGVSIGFDVDKQLQNEKPLNTFVLEFQDLLNGDYYSGVIAGLESRFFEYFMLRTGYYYYRISNSPNVDEKDSYDFTAGFGLNVPLSRFFGEGNPMTMKYDFSSGRQFQAGNNNDFDLDNFKSHSLTLSWDLGK